VRRAALLLTLVAGLWAAPFAAREAVEASAPSALAVTLYRDPDGGYGELDPDWPEGFAMITETRTVTLPPGESTIRFEGVAEGMIAISAIVTGLPGGTIEKNRNAELLSPASLIDGSLGNRVTVTRTNPATGAAVAEQAVVRTRADGGLVLQTSSGFEAVRCSGLPEKLTFDRVPAGLSAQPVFSVDTRDPSGGTYTVELTYLAWGFDWQAHYVATLAEPGRSDEVRLRLMSWLTLLNDNGQSFSDAELLVVAGKLNVVSDFEELGDEPSAPRLQLTCYPLGSTAAGSPIPLPPPPPPPPPAPPALQRAAADSLEEAYDAEANIVVTGSMRAVEEALGDLKLYRVPERVTVAAKSLKQIAFLNQDRVDGRLLYRASCSPGGATEFYEDEDEDDDEDGLEFDPAGMLLVTVNDREHGLGMALPMGGITLFEPSSFGDQLVAEARLRDYAEGQDVEIALGDSNQVFSACLIPEEEADFDDEPTRWAPLRMILINANPRPVRVRLMLGNPRQWQFRGLSDTRLKDGQRIVEVTVPGNGRHEVTWQARPAEGM